MVFLLLHSWSRFSPDFILVLHRRQESLWQSWPAQGLFFGKMSSSFLPVLSTIFSLYPVSSSKDSSFSLNLFSQFTPCCLWYKQHSFDLGAWSLFCILIFLFLADYTSSSEEVFSLVFQNMMFLYVRLWKFPFQNPVLQAFHSQSPHWTPK